MLGMTNPQETDITTLIQRRPQHRSRSSECAIGTSARRPSGGPTVWPFMVIKLALAWSKQRAQLGLKRGVRQQRASPCRRRTIGADRVQKHKPVGENNG